MVHVEKCVRRFGPSTKMDPTAELSQCSHLGQWAGPPDTILEEEHPMTMLSKFVSNWATGSRQEYLYVNFP
jgi:hypothetical protein